MEIVLPFASGVDVVLARKDGRAVTNVKQRITSHSPDGFEWGYSGSGPADLALNILHVLYPPKRGDKQKVFHGSVSSTAWRLHQQFKSQFIAPMAKEGGVIRWAEIEAWCRAAEMIV